MQYKIALVGEAYGEEEATYRRPFVGKAGQELNSLLADAGIERSECMVTNVFNLRPQGNDISNLCRKRTDGNIIQRGYPSLVRGLYLGAEYQTEVDRLLTELKEAKPNITILLGNTACWAVLQRTAISKIRGTCCSSPLLPGKFLPTYHPANILRQYENRHVTVLDLIKARRESEFSELRRPQREIYYEPTIADIADFYGRYVECSPRMALDIETASNQITCIGFAPSVDRAIVIPFWDFRQKDHSYWRSVEEEVEALAWVQKYLHAPCEKVGQNVLYDVQYLWKMWGMTVTNLIQDTMLLHHSLHPESPKSLAFLGSIYTNELAWKPNRPKGKNDYKREDSE